MFRAVVTGRRALVIGLALMWLVGCVHTLPPAKASDPIGPQQVMVVGVAGFDPPRQPGRVGGGVWDAFNVMGKAVLGFTFEPDTPVNLSSSLHGLDVVASVDPQQPFAVVAPRRTLYLRVIRMYRSYEGSAAGKDLALSFLTCTGRKKIEIRPEDTHVYVGSLICEHEDEAPIGIRVRSQYEAHEDALVALAGRPLTSRIAEDLDVSPAGAEAVYVATHRMPDRASPEAAAGTSTQFASMRMEVDDRALRADERLPLPDLGDPLLIRLLSAPLVSAGIGLGSGGVGASLGVGLRYQVIESPRSVGSLYVQGHAHWIPNGLYWTGGVAWGPGHGWWSVGAHGGVGALFPNTALHPVLGAVITSGLPNQDLALYLRYDHALSPLGGGSLTFGLEISPVGLLGAML